MILAIFLLLQTVATVSVQEQITALEAERAQLLALQRDCAPASRGNSQAALQSVIDKLTALKGEPQATPDIDVILDRVIATFQDKLKNFDTVTPDRPCTREKTAAARIGEINTQLPKLEALKAR